MYHGSKIWFVLCSLVLAMTAAVVVSGFVPSSSTCFRYRSYHLCKINQISLLRQKSAGLYSSVGNDEVSFRRAENLDETPSLPVTDINIKQQSSKREMLNFAVPALGIYLCNPLLSNIDNAFVGKTVGTAGLAALSPATICTDQMFYMFSFLGRATTGLVARAYASNNPMTDGTMSSETTEAVRQAAATRKFTFVNVVNYFLASVM